MAWNDRFSESITKFGETFFPFWSDIMPLPGQQPQLPERPALGLMGKQAAQEQASLYSSLINQALTANISNINREWGGAGRWNSGGRLQAVGQAGQQAMQTVGQLGQGSAMDIYKTNLMAELTMRQLEEQRMWNQAQLDAGQTGTWQSLGQLLPYILKMGA